MIKTEAKTEVTTNWDKEHLDVYVDYFPEGDGTNLTFADYDNLEDVAKELECSPKLVKVLVDLAQQINENLELLNTDAKEIVETIVNKEK